MMYPNILVTPAAGKTGFAAATQLLEKGYPVRALVRDSSHRSELLRRSGAEIFVGNMLDIRDLRKALNGVQRAYYCPPFTPNNLHTNMIFATAANEARLEAIRTFGNKLKVIRFFIKMLMTPAPNMDQYEQQQNYPLIKNPMYSSDSDEWLASHDNRHAVASVS